MSSYPARQYRDLPLLSSKVAFVGSTVAGALGGSALGAGAGYLAHRLNHRKGEEDRGAGQAMLLGALGGAALGGTGGYLYGNRGQKPVTLSPEQERAIEQHLGKFRDDYYRYYLGEEAAMRKVPEPLLAEVLHRHAGGGEIPKQLPRFQELLKDAPWSREQLNEAIPKIFDRWGVPSGPDRFAGTSPNPNYLTIDAAQDIQELAARRAKEVYDMNYGQYQRIKGASDAYAVLGIKLANNLYLGADKLISPQMSVPEMQEMYDEVSRRMRGTAREKMLMDAFEKHRPPYELKERWFAEQAIPEWFDLHGADISDEEYVSRFLAGPQDPEALSRYRARPPVLPPDAAVPHVPPAAAAAEAVADAAVPHVPPAAAAAEAVADAAVPHVPPAAAAAEAVADAAVPHAPPAAPAAAAAAQGFNWKHPAVLGAGALGLAGLGYGAYRMLDKDHE